MKKSSKVLSLVLALMMAVSCFTGLSLVSASAAEETTKIYFQVPDLESWGTPRSVFCHIYLVYGDGEFVKSASWGSKTESCVKVSEGLYSYDIDSKRQSGMVPGCDYGVLFCVKDETGTEHQTGNVTLTSECYGGTVYVTGNMIENTEDSSKMDFEARWTDSVLDAKYGPKAAITSTGKIVGTYFPVNQPKEQIVSQFLHNWAVTNATLITPEVVQADCATLGVDPMAVYNDYATTYAAEFLTPEDFPGTASLETVATLLGVTPVETTTEAPTTEPTTEVTEPTTVATEPTTEATEPTTVVTEPTTEATEPTTVVTEPTTVVTEPTTVVTEPTTVVTEPTTVATEPTTDVPPTEPTTPVGSIYTVAGDAGLTGVEWDPAMNTMTAGSYTYNGADYDYAITFDNVTAGSHSFKVTNGTWDASWGNGSENYSINLSAACPVTIYFNSVTTAIDVEAEFLSSFVFESITVAGNGDGTWLNGAIWDTTDTSNDMTEIADGVYQIVYTDVEAYDNYNFKFAVNHSWAYNWTSDGIFNGQVNPANVVEVNGSTVTITIDLNGFDFNTQSGSVAITFEVTPPAIQEPMIGDVDGDDEISIKDATLVQKVAVGLTTLDADVAALADVNGDGKVNVKDVTLIQKYLVNAGYDTANVGVRIPMVG